MSSPPESRCAKHGLAIGPDAQCVLCKRANAALAAPVDVPYTLSWGWLLWPLALAGVAALWSSQTARQNPRVVQLAPVTVVQHVARDAGVVGAAEPAIKTPEEQVAEAERARVLREQKPPEEELEPEAPEAPALLGDQRRRHEDEARDHARHEAVNKQLAAMSVRAARRDVVITMYSTQACSVCTLVRDYMREKNIAFKEFDVEQDEAARTQARALNPRGSVPTISVDGDIMIGFAPAWLENRIDRAAYRRAHR